MTALGAEFAAAAPPGTVLALTGGLGAGKTHFTKGFVAGLGHAGEVTSPTFSLVHEYRGGRQAVLHFDFYRLKSADELLGLGWDEFLDEGAMVVAEWADLFPELMPPETRWLTFEVAADGARVVREAVGGIRA